ncbi:unnamed protein product [Brassica oleracea]
MHFHRTNSPPNPSLLTTTVKNSNYSHRVHHHHLRKPKSHLITSTSYSPSLDQICFSYPSCLMQLSQKVMVRYIIGDDESMSTAAKTDSDW